MTEKVKILVLAANPLNTDPLRLDEEIREIQSRIRAGDFRDHFELVPRLAVRADDLLQAFNELRPDIVHFSGHGSENAELIIEDDQGNASPVSTAALSALFKHLKDNIRLVLLNACHTASQAEAISKEIDCTIGMNKEIGDEAAVVFASWVYGALAFGRPVGEAFEQGRTALLLRGIPEESTPSLLVRDGIDPLHVNFVDKAIATPVLPPLAYEILEAATTSNSPINLVPYDGGVAVLAGTKQFDCEGDLEKAAAIHDAVSRLVQARFLRDGGEGLFYVTQLGFDAAHARLGEEPFQFKEILRQMPELIAEMKADLESDDGEFVREFFVMSKKVTLGGSSKPRFAYYLEDHGNLKGKIDILENYGFLIDVTPGNTSIYRMTEEFVSHVRKYG
ncbi:MAG: CHAT domain-containing protein [Planctomycetaceae bacterium]|nr:CHAT domain-containing protein [Planctomycetaceae bacterium]